MESCDRPRLIHSSQEGARRHRSEDGFAEGDGVPGKRKLVLPGERARSSEEGLLNGGTSRGREGNGVDHNALRAPGVL